MYNYIYKVYGSYYIVSLILFSIFKKLLFEFQYNIHLSKQFVLNIIKNSYYFSLYIFFVLYSL